MATLWAEANSDRLLLSNYIFFWPPHSEVQNISKYLSHLRIPVASLKCYAELAYMLNCPVHKKHLNRIACITTNRSESSTVALIHNTSCSTRIVFCRTSLRLVLKSNWSTHPAPPVPVLQQMLIQISHDHRLPNPSLVLIHSCNFIAKLSRWNMVYKIRINKFLAYILCF